MEKKPVIHKLKTLRPYFIALIQGKKTFEVRKNDRNFKVGDILSLEEWDEKKQKFTGQFTRYKIGYILKGGQFGIDSDYVVMSLI